MNGVTPLTLKTSMYTYALLQAHKYPQITLIIFLEIKKKKKLHTMMTLPNLQTIFYKFFKN